MRKTLASEGYAACLNVDAYSVLAVAEAQSRRPAAAEAAFAKAEEIYRLRVPSIMGVGDNWIDYAPAQAPEEGRAAVQTHSAQPRMRTPMKTSEGLGPRTVGPKRAQGWFRRVWQGWIKGSFDLADPLQSQLQYAQAKPLFAEVGAVLEKEVPNVPSFRRSAFKRLAQFYEAWGSKGHDPAKAA